MEMYYVREYTPTCRFLKIINETLMGLVDRWLFLRIYSWSVFSITYLKVVSVVNWIIKIIV
jgi:hypothetical protein